MKHEIRLQFCCYWFWFCFRPPADAPKTPASEDEFDVNVTDVESSGRFPNDEVVVSSPAESCARDVLRVLNSKFSPHSDEDWDLSADYEEGDTEEDICRGILER